MFNGNELNLRIQLFMLFSTPRISLLHLWRKNGGGSARFEVFTAVKIRVEVFWVVMPLCSVVVGYQRCRDPWCLKMQHITRHCHSPEVRDMNLRILDRSSSLVFMC